MGRNVAGTSFFRGLLEHSQCEQMTALLPKQNFREGLEELVRGTRFEGRIKTISMDQMSELVGSGPVFFPGPNIGQHAWQRRFHGDKAWSLCGITHTLASTGAMDAIAELLTAPVFSWDALICTSIAARSLVKNIMERQAQYLNERFDARIFHRPSLPVIPLGIQSAEFTIRETLYPVSRSKLDIQEDELVVLFVGRLSLHAKAHPMSTYQALESVASETGKKIVFIEAGIHANEYIRDAFSEAANQCAPLVRFIRINGKDNDAMRIAWSAADIFCTLSDNIQETFGITPLEAMASGLPVIASDWDGYRDTVQHGVTGFLIPTIQPPPELNIDLAFRHALEIDSYDMYCGHTSMQVAVDISEAISAIKTLLDPYVRRSMGEAGKRRVQAMYDWKQIIPKYEDLWDQLREEARSAPELSNPNRMRSEVNIQWPARPDPFTAFSEFATTCYRDGTLLKRGSASWPRVKDLAMVKYVGYLTPDQEITKSLSNVFTSFGPEDSIKLSELLQNWAEEKRLLVMRAIAIMVKLAVIRIISYR